MNEDKRRIAELEEDVFNWKRRAEELVQQLTGEAERLFGYENDPVNCPSHYTSGGIETIDYIRAKLSPEEFQGYCKGNVLKYVSRARWKNRKEDLQKAAKYLEFALEEGSEC